MYEADKRLEGYSKYTMKGYGLQSRLLIRYIGDVGVEDVTVFQLKQYLASLTHLKTSSLSHRMKFIKSMFTWAHSEGLIANNPSHKLKEPKMGTRIPKALREEQVEALRISCKTSLESALVEFFYTTGCRVGEVVTLNRSQVDLDARSVKVVGKGNKEREVYFSIRCAIWLKRYLSERSDSDQALFVTERAPRRVSIGSVRYVIKRVAARAGIEESIYPHKMRHSYATHLLNNGAPLEIIQDLLGHAKLETTRIYAQMSGHRRRELYQRYF